VVTNFVFKTIDKNRKSFDNLNYEQINTKINATDEYFNQFKSFVTQTDGYIDLGKSKAFVKRYLTAEFCRQLLGETEYFKVVLKDDIMIKEALKH
jgi:carboxyl-terminal processing protease